MRVVLRGASLPLTVIGILAKTGVSRLEGSLRRGSAGRMSIGMSETALRAEFGSNLVADGATFRVYETEDRSGPPELEAGISHDAVYQVRVNSVKYRTSRGVSVGTPKRDLERLYWVAWYCPELAFVDELGMAFEIQNGRVGSILLR